MEIFFVKYRKSLLAGSVIVFLAFLYEASMGIKTINAQGGGNKGEAIGTILNAGVYLFLSIYFFINVRKANKKFKEENAVK